MGAASEVKTTECLFCSMCCTVAVELRQHDIAVPSYELPDEQEPRRCGRGHLIGELLKHPQRLSANAEVIEQCARKFKAASGGNEIGLIVDGNLPCEDIASVHWLAKECLRTENCAVFFPPSDLSLLTGTEAGPANYAKLKDLAKCSVVIVVGDAFATHPMVARHVLDARNLDRNNRLIVIDSVPNRTSKFATDFILTRPNTEHILLGAIAQKITGTENIPAAKALVGQIPSLDRTGVGVGDAARIAAAINDAASLSILVSSVTGKNTRYDRIGAISSVIAAAKKGTVLPLLTYGNALGAFRTAMALRMTPMAKVLDSASQGRIKCMLVIGADIVSGLGTSVGEAALKKVAFLAAAAPLPNATTGLASAVIPIGFWFEEAGTVLDMEKGPERILPVQPPPSGALTVAQLTGRLAALISGAKHSPPVFSEEILTRRARVETSALSMAEEPEEAPDGDLRLVPEGGSAHFYLGGLTSRTRWPRSMEPAPVIRLSRRRMEGLSLKAGDMVTVQGNGTAVELQARASDSYPDDVAGLSGPLVKARDLIKWRLIAEPAAIVAGPMRVKLKKGAS